MTTREEYQLIYGIIEENPGITSEEIGRKLEIKPAAVTRKIFNMASAGFLTYGEGVNHYAFKTFTPPAGRGKPRDRREINGEPIRFGKWI